MPSRADSPVDNPIKTSKQDVLERAEVAHDFAKSIRKVNASEGIVVGIQGAWGSGKTSFINLMREEFEAGSRVPVIDFNPWMFSGTQQLVDSFFREVSAELRIESNGRFGKIADGLSEYGDVLSPVAMLPVVGGWFDRSLKAFKASRQWWKDKKASSQPIRKKISAALQELEQPIVIVIDDIDRLSTDEIRDIFKLVRLTASFPNLIYVLAFDRERVEKALNETNIPGRAYLEKIIQVGYDLPVISRDVLRSQILKELNLLIGDIAEDNFDTERWPDVFVEVIEPHIDSLRDVTRYAISARPAIEALGSEVEVVDLLALEAVRVFTPELFVKIQENKQLLTDIEDRYNSDYSKEEAKVQEMVDSADGNKEFVYDLIGRIFPAARRYTNNTRYAYDYQSEWRRKHRVAHIDFLGLYLERAAPSSLKAFRRSEKAYQIMSNASALEEYIQSIKPESLEDTIKGLEVYEGDYTPETIVPGAIVLLNLIHSLPENMSAGIFDINRPDITVGRVTLRMLRSIQDVGIREQLSEQIIAGVRTFSSQLDFIESLGYRKGVGHKLVTEEFTQKQEAAFLDKMSHERSKYPKEEWDLLKVYWFFAEEQGDKYSPPKFNVNEVRSLLSSARSVMRSQSADSRAVKIEEHLRWDPLIKVFGSEEVLKKSLQRLKKADGSTPLVQLVQKYIDGWRPPRD